MKNTKVIFILFLILGILSMSSGSVFAVEWKTEEGEHFIAYYLKDLQNAKNTLKEAERYYDHIAAEIGYPRYSHFWSWDKKVKIYIYKTHDDFLKATKQPSWSHGMANYTDKYIAGYEWSEDFLDSVLPHEITHLIFRDFVGFTGQIRLWLDEGIAQWGEEKRREKKKEDVRKLYATDRLLRVDDMMKMPLDSIKKKGVYIKDTLSKDGQVAILVIDGDSLVSTYYAEAFSIIGFLIEKYGSTRFSDFCRQLRDGKTVVQALNHAYPNYLKSLDDLEKKWREYLKVDYENHGGV